VPDYLVGDVRPKAEPLQPSGDGASEVVSTPALRLLGTCLPQDFAHSLVDPILDLLVAGHWLAHVTEGREYEVRAPKSGNLVPELYHEIG